MSELATTTKEFFSKSAVKQKFEELLGKRAPAFMTSVLQIVASNALLKNADPQTVYHAAATAATLDLPLNNNLGFAYIVPFNNRRTGRQEAQFLVGYKGFKSLAIRSAQYESLMAKPVYEGQMIEDSSFQGYHFEWDKKLSDKVIGYASNFKLLNGYESTFFMTTEAVEKHAKRYSQTYKSGKGLWADDFEKMALKTVTKLHLNSGDAPLSIEMQMAIKTDQGVIKDENAQEVEYIDNQDDLVTSATEYDENLIDSWRGILAECETVEDVENLFRKNPVTDPNILGLFEQRKLELANKK